MRLTQPQLGSTVKEIREKAGLSQRALAEAADIDGGQSYLSKVERGEKGLSLETLTRVAEVLKVPLSCFLSPDAVRSLSREAAARRDGQISSEAKAVAASAGSPERFLYAHAQRLTEALTLAWMRGVYRNLDELAETATVISEGFAAEPREWVRQWLSRFRRSVTDESTSEDRGAGFRPAEAVSRE